MPDLIEQLLASPHGYGLFQAMSLLERSCPDKPGLGTSLGLDEAVRLVADPSLSFPASDITGAQASAEEGPAYLLKTPVLGLAGARGPLPLVLTERLLSQQRRRDSAAIDFLDIFNQRLLAFLYRSRRKHRPALGTATARDTSIGRVLAALAGDGFTASTAGRGAAAPTAGWLRHTALQAAAPRSMASLLALLSDRLGVRLRGRSFIGAWQPVSQADQARLGGGAHQGSPLGRGHSLGRRAWDAAAGIELVVSPGGPAPLHAWLPGQPAHRLAAQAVQSHLQSSLQTQLRIELAANDLPLQGLGARELSLGLTAWLTPAPGSVRPPDPVRVRLRPHAPLDPAPTNIP